MPGTKVEPQIKIFVSSHKDVAYPPSSILTPIQVGAEQADRRFTSMLHDDDGSDNISQKNPMYSELTAQYWAWKNVDTDYYGFCHYRRYFDFSVTNHDENDYGEVMDTFINSSTIRSYGLDDTTIEQAVAGWDVITTPLNNVTKMGGFTSLKQQYAADPHLRIKDLHHVFDILVNQHPDYATDAEAVLSSNTAAFCNMFIMRKSIFKNYNEWLFPILAEFEDTTDLSTVDVEGLRTIGHLSERLLNIFIAHHKRIGTPWRLKQLQCVHFTHPETRQSLSPLDIAESTPTEVIPVVYAADDNYVPMLATVIQSTLLNASDDYHYDLIVLERNISDTNKAILSSMVSVFPYASLRFFDVSALLDGYSLSTSNAHISNETYYRFAIQEALPFYDKLIYLDSDMVVTTDISKLFTLDLANNALAATHDMDFLGTYNDRRDKKRRVYASEKLHLKDPYNYFQAGVLLMNLRILREIHTTQEWLTLASDSTFIYNDQDILNMECQGRVTFLDDSWDVLHDCADRVQSIFAYAPAHFYKSYLAARKNPRIIHYAGFDKPWHNPWVDYGEVFWRYAQQTPFALQIVAMASGRQKPALSAHHDRVLAEDSPLRKYLDITIPVGSRRREAAKRLIRKVRHSK